LYPPSLRLKNLASNAKTVILDPPANPAEIKKVQAGEKRLLRKEVI
jgi:hypothetical protein